MSASIKDIAKALGMSISTVSLALNDKPRVSKETRELVKAKAKELNYVKNGIAADLQRKRTNLILFICNDASRSFFASVINQLQKATSYFGYDFLICTTYGNHTATAERFIKEHRADAAIIYTSTIEDEFIIENAHEDFPIIVLGRNVEGNNIYSYKDHLTRDTSSTTDYLLSTGHCKIAFVKGSSASLGTKRAFDEFKKSLHVNNIALDNNLIFEANGASYQHGYEVTKQILPYIKEIDAIQYSTDDIAIGGMMYLLENGVKIPDDISIVGRNNINESKFIHPSLTTYGPIGDNYLFYEGLVHYLIMIIEKNEESTVIRKQLKDYLDSYVHEHKLFIRDSVKNRNA